MEALLSSSIGCAQELMVLANTVLFIGLFYRLGDAAVRSRVLPVLMAYEKSY